MKTFVLVLFVNQSAAIGSLLADTIKLDDKFTYEECKDIASQFMQLDPKIKISYCVNVVGNKVHAIRR